MGRTITVYTLSELSQLILNDVACCHAHAFASVRVSNTIPKCPDSTCPESILHDVRRSHPATTPKIPAIRPFVIFLYPYSTIDGGRPLLTSECAIGCTPFELIQIVFGFPGAFCILLCLFCSLLRSSCIFFFMCIALQIFRCHNILFC